MLPLNKRKSTAPAHRTHRRRGMCTSSRSRRPSRAQNQTTSGTTGLKKRRTFPSRAISKKISCRAIRERIECPPAKTGSQLTSKRTSLRSTQWRLRTTPSSSKSSTTAWLSNSGKIGPKIIDAAHDRPACFDSIFQSDYGCTWLRAFSAFPFLRGRFLASRPDGCIDYGDTSAKKPEQARERSDWIEPPIFSVETRGDKKT